MRELGLRTAARAAVLLAAMAAAGCGDRWANEAAEGWPNVVGSAHDTLLVARAASPAAGESLDSLGATVRVLELLQANDARETAQARLALARGEAPAVRAAATRLLEDHVRHREELSRLVAGEGLILPPAPAAPAGPPAAAAGAAFDRAWLAQQAAAHQAAIAELTRLRPMVRDPEVGAAAGRALGTLQEHLALLRQAAQAVGPAPAPAAAAAPDAAGGHD